MLQRAGVAIFTDTDKKQINTVWAESIILEC
jgi:hypothetical protein